MKKYLTLPIVAIIFNACGGGLDKEQNPNNLPITLPIKYEPNDGRLLASNCFQCHGTNGVSTNRWDSIASEEKEEFYEDEHPLMSAQAKGYTANEVDKIFSWLNSQNINRSNDENDENEDDD